MAANDVFGVELDPGEADAIRAAFPALAASVTDTHTMAAPSGALRACAFLRGTLGGPCACAIYPVRPRRCRQFPIGEPLCHEARRDLRHLGR